MSQYQYVMYEPDAPPRDRIPPIAVLVGLFIVGAVALAPLPGFNYIVQGLGVILGIAYVLHIFRRRIRPSAEVFAYLIWLIWATTGAIVAVSPQIYWTKLLTLFQIWVLILIVSGFTENRRILSLNLAMFLIAAFIIGGWSYITGDYQRAEGLRGERVAGLSLNANAFGITMLMATVCMAYFWMKPSQWVRGIKYLLLIPAMALSGFAIVLSGSRKSLVGLVLFYVAWLFFCYRKEVLRRGRVLLVVVLLAGAGGFGLARMLAGSQLGDRLYKSWELVTTGKRDSSSGAERIELYLQAGRIIAENPIIGVGLDHYRIASGTLMPAHSEYAEIAADTGLIGAMIYFLWYIFLWRRAGKIAKWAADPVDRHMAGLIKATLLVLLTLALGSWYYDSKFVWILMGSFIGYSNAVWSRIRSEWEVNDYYIQTESPLPADA